MNELDHIVFEGRNKEYGAYRLRKGYPRVVILSFLVSAVFFILVFGGILFYYYTEDEPNISTGELIAMYEMMNLGADFELSPPPDLPPQSPSQETILPKPDLTTQPEVVQKSDNPTPETDKKKKEIQDSTQKTGDQVSVKGGPTDGSDTGAIFIRVERLPEFPGGRAALDKYLRESIVYPSSALVRKVSGVVHVSFMIDINGKVGRIKITKSVDPVLDIEAFRVVRLMPLWTPGRRHGRPVNVLLTLPIRFMPTR